jgi:hypothetical protein
VNELDRQEIALLRRALIAAHEAAALAWSHSIVIGGREEAAVTTHHCECSCHQTAADNKDTLP